MGDDHGTWRRPGPTPRQRRLDGYIALLVVVGAMLNSLLASLTGGFVLGAPPSWPEQVAWNVAVALPLAWRRRWPEAVAILVSVAFIAAQVRAGTANLAASIALFMAIYTLGAWGRERRRATWIRVGIIAAMFAWLGIATVLADLMSEARAETPKIDPLTMVIAYLVSSVVINMLFFVFAYFYGDSVWTSACRQHVLEVQAEELRRSQAERAERAVMEERVRIARELHDSVAHHVSVMGVQAGACRRMLDKNPAKARAALAAIEQTARTSVDELRRMLGLLRTAERPGEGSGTELGESGAPTAPGGLDQVETLLEAARQTGLTVEYHTFGTPVPLPETLSLALYRVVQEALTNTLKHAGASRVEVRLRYLRREVEVDVTDDGRGGAVHGGALVQPGAGLGLIGMRERVTAHGGVLEVGARPGGGFRVRARLPLPEVESGAETGAKTETGADGGVALPVDTEPERV